MLIRNANSQRINVPLRLALVVAAFVFLVTALVCGLGTSRSALAQEAKASSSLSFVDDPLKLKFSGKAGEEIAANVVVRNSDNQRANLMFSTVLMDAKDKPQKVDLKSVSPTSIEPYSVAPIELKIDTTDFEDLSMPLKGFLVVSAEEDNISPGTLSLTVSKVEARPPLLKDEYNLVKSIDTYNLVLGIPFVLSMALILLCYFVFYFQNKDDRDYVPWHILGSNSAFGTGLRLDFSKSWATLLTVVAALFTSFTGADVFPDVRGEPFTEEEVVGLSLAFGALLVVAPVFYNGFRYRTPAPLEEWPEESKDPQKPQPPTPGKEPDLQGYLLPLLVASAAILGALLGQLVLVVLLINEAKIDTLTPFAKWILYAIVAGTALYAIVYTWSGIRSCLKEKVRWEKESEEWKQRMHDRRWQLLQDLLHEIRSASTARASVEEKGEQIEEPREDLTTSVQDGENAVARPLTML